MIRDEPLESWTCQARDRVSLSRVFIKESISMSDGAIVGHPARLPRSGVKAGLKASGTLDLAVLAADAPARRPGPSRPTGSAPRR